MTLSFGSWLTVMVWHSTRSCPSANSAPRHKAEEQTWVTCSGGCADFLDQQRVLVEQDGRHQRDLDVHARGHARVRPTTVPAMSEESDAGSIQPLLA